MTFTKELPTTPGWYLWRWDEKAMLRVAKVDGEGEVNFTHGVIDDVSRCGGEWCKIVEATEIEKAYREGNKAGVEDFGSWENSRAKRVMEGKE